jgi:hypothetical protein
MVRFDHNRRRSLVISSAAAASRPAHAAAAANQPSSCRRPLSASAVLLSYCRLAEETKVCGVWPRRARLSMQPHLVAGGAAHDGGFLGAASERGLLALQLQLLQRTARRAAAIARGGEDRRSAAPPLARREARERGRSLLLLCGRCLRRGLVARRGRRRWRAWRRRLCVPLHRQ